MQCVINIHFWLVLCPGEGGVLHYVLLTVDWVRTPRGSNQSSPVQASWIGSVCLPFLRIPNTSVHLQNSEPPIEFRIRWLGTVVLFNDTLYYFCQLWTNVCVKDVCSWLGYTLWIFAFCKAGREISFLLNIWFEVWNSLFAVAYVEVAGRTFSVPATGWAE